MQSLGRRPRVQGDLGFGVLGVRLEDSEFMVQGSRFSLCKP